jgi:hypothetical protein
LARLLQKLLPARLSTFCSIFFNVLRQPSASANQPRCPPAFVFIKPAFFSAVTCTIETFPRRTVRSSLAICSATHSSSRVRFLASLGAPSAKPAPCAFVNQLLHLLQRTCQPSASGNSLRCPPAHSTSFLRIYLLASFTFPPSWLHVSRSCGPPPLPQPSCLSAASFHSLFPPLSLLRRPLASRNSIPFLQDAAPNKAPPTSRTFLRQSVWVVTNSR